MSELKPCPFCKSTQVWACNEESSWHVGGRVHFVQCHSCHAIGPNAATKDEAEKLWNSRAAQITPQAGEAEDGRYSLGLCADGCAILYDGVPVTVDDVIRRLNRTAPPRPVAPPVDLDAEFLRSIHEAVLHTKWMPPEYCADDWQADVLRWLRDGPPSPVAPVWQPIETAPKTWREDGYGIPILLGLPPIGALKDPGMCRVFEGRWNETEKTWTSVNGFIVLSAATHWQPLPSPPDSPGAEEE